MRINIVENWNVKSKKDKSRENISIPCAFAAEVGKKGKKKVRYTKQFKLNVKDSEMEKAKSRRYILEFEGVSANCTVELNGKKVGKHKGGFMPFSIDVTDVILFNEKNKMIVKVDNEYNNVLGSAKTKQNLYEDYVGIIRDVWLNIVEQDRFSSTVDASFSHDNCYVFQEKSLREANPQYYLCAECNIDYKDSPDDMYVVATLADSAKNVITRTKFRYNPTIKENGFLLKVLVPDAILWTPEFPYTYYLRIELYAMDQVTGEFVEVDHRVYRRGVREFAAKNGKFYVNGEEFRIKGVCHHQAYPILGSVTSRRAEFREILKLKNAGFNTIRLVGYPASKEFYEACDSLGMLVINCVPNNGGFSDDEEFKQSVVKSFAELAYRDRNYTCVAMWEGNISGITSQQGFSDNLVKDCTAAIRAAFPRGAAPIVVGDMTDRMESAKVLGFDVAYCNYNDNSKIPENVPGVPNLIGSFGKDAFKEVKKDKEYTVEQKMAEQAWAYQYVLNQDANQPNCIGAVAAQSVDYYDGKKKVNMGVMSDYRVPKTAYYFFQSQDEMAPPMVYMAHPLLATKIDKMSVYTNCDTLKVYVEDELIATCPVKKEQTYPYFNKDSNTHPEIEYSEFIKSHLNFANSENLVNPPVVIGDILKNVGDKKIRIDALSKEQVVKSWNCVNSDTPYMLRIFVDYGGIALANDEHDFVFVHVALVDNNGNVVCRDGERISLSIKGGDIINYSESKTVSGMASFMVRAFEGTDKVLLKAVTKAKYEVKEAYAKLIVKP